MHDTAYRIGGLVLRTYCDLENAKVLEVGSFDVNGALRKHALPSTDYIGVDIEEGPGVDALIEIGKPYPFDDETFDMVMASSVFEHDPAFWMTFIEMCRKTKAGGHIYISAPANGTVHRYPQDNWRFYPDAGLALVRWAQSQGQEIELVESFVADRQGDVWNDFCAVFRKGPSTEPLPTALVSYKVPCSNVHTWQSSAIYNPKDMTEDMEIINRSRERIAELERELAADVSSDHAQKLAEAEQAHAETKGRLEEVEGLLSEAMKESARRDRQLGSAKLQSQELLAEREQLEKKLAQADQDLTSLRNATADLENNLRQRQEEIQQSWTELREALAERDGLHDQLKQAVTVETDLRAKLSESEDWLFKLSGDRRAAEAELHQVRQLLEAEKGQRSLAESAVLRSSERAATAQRRLDQRHQTIAELVEQLRLRELEMRQLAEENIALERANREQGRALEIGERRLAWLSRVDHVLVNLTGWHTLLPPTWRRRWELEMLRRHGLFDAEAYLNRYPDVAEVGMDPLEHYILHGMHEGRIADGPA